MVTRKEQPLAQLLKHFRKEKKISIHMNSLLEFLAFDRESHAPPGELIKLWVVL